MFGRATIRLGIGPHSSLFCNTVQPLLSSLQAELNLDYLDDVTLGSKVETVAY